MIQNIFVDGFRSLLNTTVTLKSGLNVFVGANGAGKSNFIAFLDFVGVFVEDDLKSALAHAHGASSVFSRERIVTESAQFDFSIQGIVTKRNTMGLYSFISDESALATYSYSASIVYTRRTPAIYVASERVEISSEKLGRLIFLRTTVPTDVSYNTTIETEIENENVRENLWRWARVNPKSKETSLEEVAYRLSPDSSLLRVLANETSMLSLMVEDLGSYRSLNIDPGLARKPTPVGSAASIKPTGEGLAGSLYRLKRGEHGRVSRRGIFMQREEIGDFESIVSWCKEVNPNIETINVNLDFMEALFKPFLIFNFNSARQTYPFSQISDGTVKWISLVTMLLADIDLNIVEEPENFLHPFMQESFISLCRKVIERAPGRAILISTHSPTLLDACRPDEITIFELEDGRTRAASVMNADELRSKIERSRFGLGYYYKTGALYGEDRSSR